MALVNSSTVDAMCRSFGSRGIARVVHFHCDHFEPFRADKSGTRIGLEHVQSWNSYRQAHPLGTAPSLFLHTKGICYVPNPDEARKVKLHKAGDIYFADSSVAPEEQEIYAFLREQEGLDFQVHLHHEYWTASNCTAMPRDAARDAERIRAALRLNLAYYAKHLGTPSTNWGWGFVHGCWALNASDRDICNITSELMVLHALGCRADFSFPAGRPWCDPAFKRPFTVIPFDAERCYDRQEARPRMLTPGGNAWTPDRILIWSCDTPTGYLSLDCLVDQGDAEPMANAAAAAWAASCPTIGDTLYIKTHGHSLRWTVWEDAKRFSSLFTSPTAQLAYATLQAACSKTGATIEHLSVTDVMHELSTLDSGA